VIATSLLADISLGFRRWFAQAKAGWSAATIAADFASNEIAAFSTARLPSPQICIAQADKHVPRFRIEIPPRTGLITQSSSATFASTPRCDQASGTEYSFNTSCGLSRS